MDGINYHRFTLGQKVLWQSDETPQPAVAVVTELCDFDFGQHEPMYWVHPQGFPKPVPAFEKELSELTNEKTPPPTIST